jgi:hypothetical protein
MTNVEIQMTKECRSPNAEVPAAGHLNFDIRHCLLRASVVNLALSS